MNNKKCFDVVSVAVKKQSERIAPLWKLNEEKYESLKICCNQIDGLSNKIDTYEEDKEVNYSVKIDDKKNTIAIFMSIKGGEMAFFNFVLDKNTYEIAYRSSENIYYLIAEKALSAGFSATDNETLIVSFVFESVWEKLNS